MKKQLLFLLAAGAGFSLMAQNSSNIDMRYVSSFDKSTTIDNYNPSATQPFQKRSVGAPHVSPQAVNSFTIGTAGNIFTVGQNRTYLWADPSINSVAFSHRYEVGTGTNAVGFLTFDYSKNGGAAGSWNVNAGTVYDPAAAPVSAFGARYPQGVIYNPPGNTIADSAYFSYYAPTRDNTNPSGTGDWGGIAWGGQQLSGLGFPTQVDTGSNQAPTTSGYWFVIPDDMFITKTGVTHVIERNAKGDGTGAYPTSDTLIYTRGTWDTTANNFVYQREKLVIPISTRANSTTKLLGDIKISFADNGTDGYLSIIGHNSFTVEPDSTYYLIVYQTSDGGDNWTGPTNIILDGISPFFPQFPGAGINNFTTAFEHDPVVDSLGNLHMIVGIGGQPVSGGVPTGWSILSGAGNWGLFDVYTSDKGTSWKAHLLDYPQFFRGNFGAGAGGVGVDLSEDTRPYASRNWNGSKLVFSWFVSDSVTNSGYSHNNQNIWPDLFTKGYDVNTNMWTSTVNQTGGLFSPIGGIIYFGNSSYYTFETSGGGLKLPVVYANFNNPTFSTEADVQFNYLDSVILDNSGFTIADQSVTLFTGYASVEDNVENHLKVSQNVPNPFNNTSVINVALAENANVSLEVYNSLGQLVMSEAPQSLNAGNHRFIVNGSYLDKGIYFYTVKAGEYTVTKRMIVQ